MNLSFRVNKQIITRKDRENVVSDSRNYLYAAFSFSEEWIGTKTAIFKNDENAYCVILYEDRCLVPWEVIKPKYFTVSVFCGDLVTANKVIVRVLESGYEEGETPEDPTPDVYQQIIEMLEDINQGQQSEETIAMIVAEYMEEHPIDLSGYATEKYVKNAVASIDLSLYALADHAHSEYIEEPSSEGTANGQHQCAGDVPSV